MKENKEALDQGLVWIMEEHDQTPTRSELHAMVKKAATRKAAKAKKAAVQEAAQAKKAAVQEAAQAEKRMKDGRAARPGSRAHTRFLEEYYKPEAVKAREEKAAAWRRAHGK